MPKLHRGGGETGSQNTAAESAGTEASGDTQQASSGETSELYWYSTVTGWGPSARNVDSSPATEYIEENIGLTLNIEQPPTNADTKLGLMIASGDLPDLMSIADPDTYKQLVQSGMVWDMQSFLETYAP